MLVIALTVVLIAFIQPILSGYDPMETPNINNPSMRFIRPNGEFWFGTDDKGNSLFDAVWAGTRNSLIVSFSATIITQILGVTVGMFWGFSKRFDAIMIQIYNVLANIPMTLVAMIMMYVLGSGMPQLIFALSVTSWISTAYFIRVQVMIIRDREYNLASRCLGTSTVKIITHNIFPYLISVIMTSISRDVPSFISYEVFLSFIGDSPIVAHNGLDFDFPFINHELRLVGLPEIPRSQQFDSIVIARNRVFGPKSYSLDALAKWYGISLTARADAHGALIDAEILAKVYKELENTAPAPDVSEIIAKQHADFLAHPKIGANFPHRTFQPHADELAAHNEFMEKITA